MERHGSSVRPVVVVHLSFEGPDPYARAGGLGTRVMGLDDALAAAGVPVHLLFVGDPDAPAQESRGPQGNLHLYRWCQWISAHHRNGVYAGEEVKVADYSRTVPEFVVERLVRPALAEDKLPVILAEDWQTAEALCNLSDLLHERGMRRSSILVWNANNTMGFERINWGRLGYVAHLATVSHYMKHQMWQMGFNPVVIGNGIEPAWLDAPDPGGVSALREAVLLSGHTDLFVKVARWDPDKRWEMAIQAMAQLRREGRRPTLVVRGGLEPYGGQVRNLAESLGMRWRRVATFEPLARHPEAPWAEDVLRESDVLEIDAVLDRDRLRALYAAADGVLANSGMEPFGLVGLEAMASGGIAYTGATGEEYARPFENAVVLETDDPAEIVAYARMLAGEPRLAAAIRRSARETARRFTWPRTVAHLFHRLAYLSEREGLPCPSPAPSPTVRSDVRLRRSPRHPAALRKEDVQNVGVGGHLSAAASAPPAAVAGAADPARRLTRGDRPLSL
ncbi:glycosyltransferase family 4 protein [Limnochorda pilosa]|uniref:Glycosyl transferase group 1 n=1 Tax=Limnochorda pilosa TaxID=1555112 RepID=A0A0K2SKG3_LIMPI|nr:glycosyltransferase family 4 protein [Limnochorda pilosa]BAS27603.1 glycosyl transferase group 1 [Limnochorda pilosa]